MTILNICIDWFTVIVLFLGGIFQFASLNAPWVRETTVTCTAKRISIVALIMFFTRYLYLMLTDGYLPGDIAGRISMFILVLAIIATCVEDIVTNSKKRKRYLSRHLNRESI